MKLPRIPLWYWLTFLIAALSNVLGGAATYVTIGLMRSPTPFAHAVRDVSLSYLPHFQCVIYPLLGGLITYYLWPVITYFSCGRVGEPSLRVQQRVVSAPLVVALLGYSGWLLGPFVFGAITIAHFGRWSTELMSQQVLSPLVNGFLAAMVCYLLVDWVFRALVVPAVFPGGRLSEVPGTFSFGVRGRLFIFLAAVPFIPLFPLLGLMRAATVRLASGLPAEELLAELTTAGELSFLVFVALSALLTVILSRSLTIPLEESARALRRVQGGDLRVAVPVRSGDEVGMLSDGVNEMVEALRDRERILQTFGRVVEPAVRDHLLSGRAEGEGELRTASILFCDLRGFTAMSEKLSPNEVVETLNEFFTVSTDWVRDCGGFVDKFIGDALLVVFGLFEESEDRAASSGAAAAARCALGMRDRLTELNARRAECGQAAVAVSMGVHSGEVLVGTIGSADRHEYTVIGDTVNVAARLQSLSKEHEGALLMSEATFSLLNADDVRKGFIADGEVRLRGRSGAVRVYRQAPSSDFV